MRCPLQCACLLKSKCSPSSPPQLKTSCVNLAISLNIWISYSPMIISSCIRLPTRGLIIKIFYHTCEQTCTSKHVNSPNKSRQNCYSLQSDSYRAGLGATLHQNTHFWGFKKVSMYWSCTTYLSLTVKVTRPVKYKWAYHEPKYWNHLT